jgi:hypothetical protein
MTDFNCPDTELNSINKKEGGLKNNDDSSMNMQKGQGQEEYLLLVQKLKVYIFISI